MDAKKLSQIFLLILAIVLTLLIYNLYIKNNQNEIIMSLYEKYNSQINIDHMFHVTSDVLKNQCNIDITVIPQAKENFVQKMKETMN